MQQETYRQWVSARKARAVAKKQEWEAFKAERYGTPGLRDEVWEREVLTQPAAIKIATYA